MMDGLEMLRRQEELHKISFGEQMLDNLLEGGLKSGNIYELTGMPCSGKSSLAQKIVAQNFIQSGRGAWYLDIHNQFDLPRFLKQVIGIELKQNLSFSFKQNGLCRHRKEIERKIYHSIVQDPKSLYMMICVLLNHLNSEEYSQKNEKVNVLVIDNFGVIMKGGNAFNEYSSYMMHISQQLKLLCSQFQFTVLVITNQEEKLIYKQKQEDIYRTKSVLNTPWNFIPNATIIIDTQIPNLLDSNTRSLTTQYSIITDLNYVIKYT